MSKQTQNQNNEAQMTDEELLDFTMVKMLFREPFYANLLINMNKQLTTEVPTAAVYVTDNVNLIVNPYWFRNMNLDQRIDILKHECHHVINNHFVRFRELEPQIYEEKEKTMHEKYESLQNASLLNQAADFAINEYLPNFPKVTQAFDKEGKKLVQPDMIKGPNGQPIPNPKAGQPVEFPLCVVNEVKKMRPDLKNMKNESTTEYYYTFLKQEQEKQKQQQQQQGGGQGQGQGQGQQGDEDGDGQGNTNNLTGAGTVDDHSYWHKSDASDEQITRKVKEVVNKAAEQTSEKDMGKLPGDVKLAIDRLNYVPRDWRQDIQRFAARVSEMKIEASRKKRNRRYGVLYPGAKIYPELTLAIGWDTSGSMGEEERNQINAELVRLHNMGVKMTVIECDSRVAQVFQFDAKKPLEVKGGGGTAFKPVFDVIDKQFKNEVDGCIYFTDGECYDEKIKTPPFPVLWALTTGYGGKHNDSYVKKYFNGSRMHTQTTKVEIKKKTR